jgi:hypothetical protein
MFVKCLVGKKDWEEFIGLYAVNFDSKPHLLDVSIPLPAGIECTARVFDDRAGDWTEGKEEKIVSKEPLWRYRVEVPANSAWSVFIFPPKGQLYLGLGAPSVPEAVSPAWEQGLDSERVTLTWKAAAGMDEGGAYEVQLAKEALFRPQDIVCNEQISAFDPKAEQLSVTLSTVPPWKQRYHWRVRAISRAEISSGWSRSQAFVFHWEEYAKWSGQQFVPKETPPPAESPPSQLEVIFNREKFDQPGNLAYQGQTLSWGRSGNLYGPPSRAVDGTWEHGWTNYQEPPSELHQPAFYPIPCWWAVTWPEKKTFTTIKALWTEGIAGKEFEFQAWDGQGWQKLTPQITQEGPLTVASLAQPVNTQGMRIYITAGETADNRVGISEVYVGE